MRLGRSVLGVLCLVAGPAMPIAAFDFAPQWPPVAAIVTSAIAQDAARPIPADRGNLPGQAEPTARFHWQVLAVLAAFLVQAAVLMMLFYERHRRQIAEQSSRQRFLELAKLDRAVTASGMSISIAHEISQPLGSILNNAEAAEMLLRARAPDLAQLKEIVEDIRRDDQRAISIIRQLRSLIKQSEPEPQPLDLAATIRSVAKLLEPQATEHGVAIELDMAASALTINADPVHIQQVILNLAVNGIEAMQATTAPPRTLTLHAYAAGDEVVTAVEDSGAGIGKERLSQVFKPFVTTKQGGTGLGLSIAKTIVETYGGHIWAESRAGGGARFCFALPRAQTEAAAR